MSHPLAGSLSLSQIRAPRSFAVTRYYSYAHVAHTAEVDRHTGTVHVHWDKVLGLATILFVSTAGWTAFAVLVERFLR